MKVIPGRLMESWLSQRHKLEAFFWRVLRNLKTAKNNYNILIHPSPLR